MKYFTGFFNGKDDSSFKKRRTRKIFIPVIIIMPVLIAASIWFFFSGNFDMAFFRGKPKKTEIFSLWEAGKYPELDELCDRVLEIDPLDEYALVFRGLSAYYQSIEEPDPLSRQELVGQSIGYLRKSLSAARPLLENQARYVLGKAYYTRGEDYWDLSLQELDRASDAGYSPDDSWEYRALAAYGSGQLERSLEYFNQALGKFSDSPELFMAAARAWADSGMNSKAESLALSAISASTDDFILEIAEFFLLELYMGSGNYEKAKEFIASILERNPESAEAWYLEGMVLLEDGDTMAARNAWRKAVSIDPMHALARQKLTEKQ